MLARIRRLQSTSGGIKQSGWLPYHRDYMKSFELRDLFARGGPIIEQATHFCDLSRYFGGDVDLSTLHATTLEWDEPAGALAKVPVDESKIMPANRIPRITSANW